MRTLSLFFCLFAVGCSSSNADEGPCARRSGTYRLTYERVDGDCGDISAQIVTGDEKPNAEGTTVPADAPCRGSIITSGDNCAVTLSDLECPEPATGGHSKIDGKVYWSHDGANASGDVAFVGYDRSGAVGCSGSYKMTETRL